MAQRKVQLKDGTNIYLDLKPFASGAEGELYKIIEPSSLRNQVVKIYKIEKRTKDREEKINYLFKNRPNIPDKDGHHPVIWINNIVYENGNFCGFTMYEVKGEKLEMLCHAKLHHTLKNEWSKFDFQSSKSNELRLKLCFNIAVAIHHVHKLNKYILVDLKPDNIMVQSNGLISIVDIDSLAVVNGTKLIYYAPVATPEYTPPEYYRGQQPDKDGLNNTWDRFGMAVIFYRLLCGLHPFAGTSLPPYDDGHDVSNMIKHGLFAHGNKKQYFKVIPQPHSLFHKLEKAVQNLFIRCFDDGFKNADLRPNPEEWCKNLLPFQEKPLQRPLLSKQFSFPTYTYSKDKLYNPSIRIELPDIQYIKPKVSKSIRYFFSFIVGKSNKQKLMETVIVKENEIRLQHEVFQTYSNDLREIVKSFYRHQEVILQSEKNRIEKIKNEFAECLEVLDSKSNAFQLLEVEEYNKIYKFYSEAFEKANIEIEDVHSKLIGERQAQHKLAKGFIEKRIRELQEKEHTEIGLAKADPSKLSLYRILSYQIPNVSPQLKIALAASGINNAADFTDIDNDGRFKTKSGSWRKVAGIGFNRAFALKYWKDNIEQTEDAKITRKVNDDFSHHYLDANLKLANLESNFIKQIVPFQKEFTTKKTMYEESKKRLIEGYNLKIKWAKEDYDRKNSNIVLETTRFIEQNIKPKIHQLKVQIQQDIEENLSAFMKFFALKMKEIHEKRDAFIQEINILKGLQAEMIMFESANRTNNFLVISNWSEREKAVVVSLAFLVIIVLVILLVEFLGNT